MPDRTLTIVLIALALCPFTAPFSVVDMGDVCPVGKNASTSCPAARCAVAGQSHAASMDVVPTSRARGPHGARLGMLVVIPAASAALVQVRARRPTGGPARSSIDAVAPLVLRL